MLDQDPIRFSSSKFNTTEIGEHFINDICFGEDVAHWLVREVDKRGLNAIEPWQEDWGWQFEIEDCLISIGFDGNEWLIHCDPIVGFFQKLWGNRGDNSRVLGVIRKVLENEPEINMNRG